MDEPFVFTMNTQLYQRQIGSLSRLLTENTLKKAEGITMTHLIEVLNMINDFLSGTYEPFAFSADLPGCLCEYYDDMYSENSAMTKILNEELPEICAEYEPGFDPAPFMAAVKREYERALDAL